MTIEEMKKAIAAYCNAKDNCIHGHATASGECPLRWGSCNTSRMGDPEIELAYKVLVKSGVLATQMTPESSPGEANSTGTEFDPVDRPRHYNREGAMESIDEMILIFGREAVMHFCLCNVFKYRYRAAAKNGEEDLKKSDWYMRKYKELKEAGHDPA